MEEEIGGNPVGQAKEDQILSLVEDLAKKWVEQEPQQPGWWQATERHKLLCRAIKYLLEATDVLVNCVEKLVSGGPDKKATVILAVNALYTLTVRTVLPIWAIPVAKGIKYLIVNVLISLLIDFMVDKYRKGSWSTKNNTNGQS